MRVAVLTGGRADYGLLHPLLSRLLVDERFDLRLIVTGAHLSEAHGLTVTEIERDGIPIAERVALPLNNSRIDVARAMGEAVSGIAEALDRTAPDVLVILGDRYEALAAASAATVMRVPVAHIHGGELTFGAIDDAFRHAITKMASVHFASAEPYRERIIQMGEAPESVFNVGALAVDNIKALDSTSAEEFARRFGVEIDDQTLLVTFHPVSMAGDSRSQLETLLNALDALDGRVVFMAANADAEGEALNARIQQWVTANDDRAVFVNSLGREGYLAAARLGGIVVGNSSSGVIEIPALGVPSVDIGDRQAGRIRPETVIHVESDADAIAEAIGQARSAEFRTQAAAASNPYGEGRTAEAIVGVLAKANPTELCGAKRFHDYDHREEG